MNGITLVFLTVLSLLSIPALDSHAQGTDTRDLIREARQLAIVHGNAVWPGFGAAPFGILLVDGDREYLFCHDGVPSGFDNGRADEVVGCDSYSRPATFPANLLASFPAVDAIPTIVIGTPGNTGKSEPAWVLTLLHEHFHQLQYAWPGYYEGTQALDLAGDDISGMWMLEYPFPYQNDRTAAAFAKMAAEMTEALKARGTADFVSRAKDYVDARRAAADSVSPKDWRYFEFQVWQEGVARWTENAVAGLSPDHQAAADEARSTIFRELADLDIARQGRASFYPIGAGEALILDAAGDEWRRRYWSEPFQLGPSLDDVVSGRE